MRRPHSSEVALVKRRDLRFAQALGERHHAGIDDPEREVCILRLKFTAAGKIGHRRWFDAVDAREQIVEKHEPGFGRKSASAPVVEFGEDEHRNHQILVRIDQEPSTPLVIGIGSVERREQGARVADEGHVSVRLVGDGLGRDIGCAAAISRPCYPDTRTPACTELICLLFNGFPKHGRERDASSLRLRLQCCEDGSWRADGGPTKLGHDA